MWGFESRPVLSPGQALSQGKHQEAVVHLQRCRELLSRIPKDVGKHFFVTITTILYMLCFHIPCIYCTLGSVGWLRWITFFPCRRRMSPLCATTLVWTCTMRGSLKRVRFGWGSCCVVWFGGEFPTPGPQQVLFLLLPPHFSSQSYDIGKINAKYGPDPEVQVGEEI